LGGCFGCEACTGDEAGDERIFRWEEADNLCANADLCSDGGAEVFAFPVDAEEVGAFAADAQYEGFASDIDAVVLVGDAAGEGCYYRVCVVEFRDLMEDVFDLVVHCSLPS